MNLNQVSQSENPLPPEQLIVMRCRPMWQHIDGIRQFCGFFARTSFSSTDLGERVALVIHELIENAIKYSVPTDLAELDVTILHTGRQIEICVGNTPRPAQLAQLQTAISTLRGKSPEDGYLEAMRETRTLPVGRSGLGLARIRFEARMELQLIVVGGLARIIAKGDL
jgi:hypothetical protein